MGISILIPAYNEEEGITKVLEELLAVFPNSSDVEILVINDGSNDRTPEMFHEFQNASTHWPGSIRLIAHEQNRGYGASLKTGISEASNEDIVIIDADGTYPAETIPLLVAGLESNKMVVGARTGAKVQVPLIRKPAKWILGLLANYLASQKIPDMNSGLRAFKKRSAEQHLNILPDGFSFTTTITMALLTSGEKVAFVPIDYRRRKGRSKIRPIRDTLNFLALLLRTSIYFNPLRAFVPISLFFFLIAFALFGFSWQQGQILDATVSILLMTGVQVAVLGLLADLVVRRSSNRG